MIFQDDKILSREYEGKGSNICTFIHVAIFVIYIRFFGIFFFFFGILELRFDFFFLQSF